MLPDMWTHKGITYDFKKLKLAMRNAHDEDVSTLAMHQATGNLVKEVLAAHKVARQAVIAFQTPYHIWLAVEEEKLQRQWAAKQKK